MASLSCIAVLVLGNFLGATVKGVTGFGSAILNLCVWVVFTCVGVNAGTLQQAVISECLCSEAVAVPLLVMTNARSTCDWRLVTSLAIFGAVGAPVGAALLTNLQPRYVEFMMACVLMLVITLHCKVFQRLAQCYNRSTPCSLDTEQQGCQAPWQQKQATLDTCSSAPVNEGLMHAATSEECTANVALTASQLDRPSAGDNKTNSRALPSLQLLEADGPLLPAFNSSGSTTSRQSVLELDAVAVAGRTSSVYSLVSAAATPMARVCNSSSCSAQQQAAAAAEAADVCDDEQPLLHHHCASYSSVSSVQDSCTAGSRELRSIHDSSVGLIGRAWHVCSSCRDAVTDWWAYSSQPEQRAAIARTFLIGSAAGTASGIMSGMTGMGGPPMMYMYDKLSVPKDTVRGSNAVLGVLQFRIIAYAVMGAFVPEDWVLYVACTSAGMVGMYWGNKLAARMNQQAFSRMMVFLMTLCCVLLFASSAGLTGS